MPMVLPIHVVAAALGLLSGFVALSAAKGAKVHRKSGILFVYAIVAMCITGIVMAVAKGNTANAIVGVVTAYMVVTALTTVRPSSPGSLRLDAGLMVVALLFGLATLTFGIQALASVSGEKYGIPAVPLFIISAVGLLGGAGDFGVLRSGGLRGAPRLTRHLWRMCLALWLTVFSFFGSRTRTGAIFPEPLLIPAVRFFPVLLVFVVMLYWLWRVRIRRSLRGTIVAGASRAA